MRSPPIVDMLHQRMANLCGGLLFMGMLEPDKGGIGIAVNDLIALRLDQLTRAMHDLVAAHGNRRRQTRIKEATSGRTKHAIERIHDDLERLRQWFIVLTLGGFAALPDLRHDGRQTMLAARKASAAKTGDGI